MGAIVVVVVLPFLELDVEQAGIVDDLSLEESVELLGVSAVERSTLPFQAGGARSDANVTYAVVEQVPWKAEPSSWPLSVWIWSAANGSLDSTWSTKAIAVGWSLRR